MSRCLIVLLLAFLTGCISDHLVDVTVARIDESSLGSNGLTQVQAQDIFKDVAGQLGFEVVGPIQQPLGHESVIQYIAGHNGAHGHLNVYIIPNANAISFYSVADDWETAKRYASLFEQALDKRGVHYRVTTRTGNPLNS